jgi:hypothetical protein
MPLLRWNRKIDKVDATMDQIREQMEISNEISDAISNPVNMGIDVDDVSYAIYKLAARLLKLPFLQEELKNELEELEQEQLNDRLMGAERAPVHALPTAATTHAERRERAYLLVALLDAPADNPYIDSYRGQTARGRRRRGSSASTTSSRNGHVGIYEAISAGLTAAQHSHSSFISRLTAPRFMGYTSLACARPWPLSAHPHDAASLLYFPIDLYQYSRSSMTGMPVYNAPLNVSA